MTDISLYFHLPFCRRRCAYCSFISFAGREMDIPAYVDAAIIEVELTRRQNHVVKTIYFGGGTPSLLRTVDIQKLVDAIGKNYDIDSGAEITLEANPGTVDAFYLRQLRAVGVNRLSLGVQSLHEEELSLLGRSHTSDEARRSVSQARDAGFDNLSLDFIYGIPDRRLSDWDTMLNDIIGLGADHLSLYGLTLEDDTPLGIAASRGEIPIIDPDAAASEYELAVQKLDSAGYRQYEISNWAHPGAESRHNLVYWRRGEYLGLGAAAHSFINGQRIANSDSLDDYLSALAVGELPRCEVENIDLPTALSEAIILGLRLNDGVYLDDIERQFSIDLLSRFKIEIAELSSLGLIIIENRNLKLTARGRLLGNEVFIRFLPS